MRNEVAKLRSSCRGCRKRKVKCNGESPCSPCVERRVECIFDLQARMGRPLHRPVSGIIYSGNTSCVRLLGTVLDNLYEEIFLAQQPRNAFSAALKSYMKERAPHISYGEQEMQEQHACSATVFDVLLPLLIKDLIETCKYRFSSHGRFPSSGRPSFLAVALARDQSIPFWANVASDDGVGLQDAEFHHLANVWSKMHPLSCCVSISQALGPSTLCKALRYIIASEALTMKNALGQRSEGLFRQAHKHFLEARLPQDEHVSTLFLACQVSALLAWNHIASIRAKTGVTFLALSCQLLSALQDNSLATTGGEKVTLERLAGVLSLMTVWAFSQLDRSSGFQVHQASPHLFSSTAQMCSMLLNNHPDIICSSSESAIDRDTDFAIVCKQLKTTLESVPLDSSEETGSVKETLKLSLLIPLSELNSTAMDELFSSCADARLLLARLASDSKGHGVDEHLLSKLPFHRPTFSGDETGNRTAMTCTLAAVLFETLVEAAQVIVSLAEQKRSSTLSLRLLDWSRQLLDTPMTMMVETATMKQARNNLARCSEKLEILAAEQSLEYLDEELVPSSELGGWPSWENAVADDLDGTHEQLWGHLQWDFHSDISLDSS